jgi:hypothetical protein
MHGTTAANADASGSNDYAEPAAANAVDPKQSANYDQHVLLPGFRRHTV